MEVILLEQKTINISCYKYCITTDFFIYLIHKTSKGRADLQLNYSFNYSIVKEIVTYTKTQFYRFDVINVYKVSRKNSFVTFFTNQWDQ